MESNVATLPECLQQLEVGRRHSKQLCLQTLQGVLSNLVHIITTSDKAKKQLAAQSVTVLSLFVSALQKAQDPRTVYNIVLILKEILSVKSGRAEQARILLSLDVVNILLPHLVSASRDALVGEEYISALYYILAIVCKKADTNLRDVCHSYDVVPLTLSALKKYTARPKVLNSVLLFAKYLAAKAPTSTQLIQDGLISHLHALLGPGKCSLNLTTLYVLETLSVITYSKHAVLYILQHGGLSNILKLLDPNSWSASGRKGQRSSRIFKALLQTLLHMGLARGGRQILKETDSPQLLLCWAKGLPARDVWNRHILLVSLIIQRCLPPLPIPITSATSPLSFPLPEKTGVTRSNDYTSKPNCDDDEDNDDDSKSSSIDDIESLSSCSTEEDLATSIHDMSFRTLEELEEYEDFFPELHTKKSIGPDTFNVEASRNDCNRIITTEERQALLRSCREDKRADLFLKDFDVPTVYTEMAQRTRHITPWVGLPHPDLADARGTVVQELLYKQPSKLIRSRLFQHLEERLSITGDHSTEIVVFDLDSVLLEKNSTKNCACCDKLESKSHGHLQFESRFESGNLRKALWVGDKEYNLILSPDINTDCHHQWFYFRVSGMEPGVPYTFNIINCEKSGSLFNMGMRPLLFAAKDVLSLCHWVRVGSDVCYYRNHFIRSDNVASILRDKPFYTASFTVSFPHTSDACYLAYFYPYSYSLLQTHLYRWQHSHDTSIIYFQNAELCQTLLGNSVPVLTITAQPPCENRRYIFLTARVHPGESNSSWIMKGVIDFLLGNKQNAQKLREKFIFKVVPMLNPDGVLSGCHRCSMSGEDLNRQWICPTSSLYPTIYHTKSLLEYLHAIQKVPLVYCDFHGHSRKHNIFLYGCSPSDSWLPDDACKFDRTSYQVLPRLLSELAPAFSSRNCCFAVEQNKESTARITVWRQFGVALSYTMECSYGGCEDGVHAGYHLSTHHLEEMGAKFCQALGKLDKRMQEPSCSSR